MTVTGAGAILRNTGNVSSGIAGTGTLTVSSGGQAINGAIATIGYSNGSTGTLNVLSGGSFSNTEAYIGRSSGSIGTATVSGSGSVWTNAGDLYVGESGTGTLTVADGGEVSADVVYIASVSGSVGTMNIGAALGSAAATAGTVTTSSVVFGAGAGTIVFNVADPFYVFSPDVAGSGAIKVDSGVVAFTGDDSAYSGTATVASGATLEADGAFSGTVSVADGATLRGTGSLDSLVLASGATIAPGVSQSTSTGTLSVSGAYTQAGGANMSAVISPSAVGQLVVSGTASLDGALTVTPVAGTYIRGATYTLVSAASVNGAFSSFVNADPSIVTLALSYADDAVHLMTNSGATNLTSAATGENQGHLAAAIDTVSPSILSGNFNDTLNVLAALPSTGQARALNELAPHVSPHLALSAVQNMSAVFNVLAARMTIAVPRNITLAQDFGPRGEERVADAYGNYWGRNRALQSDYTVWLQGVGGTSTLTASDDERIDSAMGGVTMGIEAQLTRRKRIGIALGAVRTDLRSSQGAQRVEQQSYTGGLYGGYNLGAFALDASALINASQARIYRDISFLGARARGETNGFGGGIEAGASYRFDLDDKETTLTPRLGVSYAYNWENGYSETGADGANLQMKGNGKHYLQTTVDMMLETKVLVWLGDDETPDSLYPHIQTGWEHNILNPATTVEASFVDVAGSAFSTVGQSPGRDAAKLGMGFSYIPGDIPTLSVYTNYGGTFFAKQTSHVGTGGIKYSW